MFWPAEQVAEEVKGIVVQCGELMQSRLLTGIVQYEQKQYVFSPKSGLVGKIHAVSGQRVYPKDLLIQMDTTAEEKALEKLYQMQAEQTDALYSMGSTAFPLIAQGKTEIQESITALSTAVEASAIRSETEGIVEVWFVEEGEVVSEGAPIGIIRGDDLQVSASGYLVGAKQGMTARTLGAISEPLVLRKVSQTDDFGQQTLFFDVPEEARSRFAIGETIDIEVITEVKSVEALIPLSAVDADGNIWYVEDGKAHKRAMQKDAACSREYCEVPIWWLGKSVIVEPDQHELYIGKAVRVKE